MEKKASGASNSKPAVLDNIGIDEHLGDQIDLDLSFTDDHGEEVKLKKYFNDKPVLMLLIYYECPTLCNLHLNSLFHTLRTFKMEAGREFEFVAVSIDPDESYKLAAQKKAAYLKELGKPSLDAGWHFLTGKKENIDKLASQIGFNFAWDQNMQQWAHSAAAYSLTPKGVLSYYHYGLNIEDKVLRLSLVEASENKIGNIVDRLVLFCLQYDPDKKTYSFYAFNLMKVAALITAIFLGIFFFRFWRKEFKSQKKLKEEDGQKNKNTNNDIDSK